MHECRFICIYKIPISFSAIHICGLYMSLHKEQPFEIRTFSCVFVFAVSGIEPTAPNVQNKCSVNGLHASPKKSLCKRIEFIFPNHEGLRAFHVFRNIPKPSSRNYLYVQNIQIYMHI